MPSLDVFTERFFNIDTVYVCYLKNSYLQGCKKACRITHKKQLYDQFFCDDLDLEPRHIPCHTDCMLPVNQNMENVRALLH